MKSMLAPLSPDEENALKLIGFRVEIDHSLLLRLLERDLIDWDGCSWNLTKLGRRHYDRLVRAGSERERAQSSR